MTGYHSIPVWHVCTLTVTHTGLKAHAVAFMSRDQPPLSYQYVHLLNAALHTDGVENAVQVLSVQR